MIFAVLLLLGRMAFDRIYVPTGGFTKSYAITVSVIYVGIFVVGITALCWPWTSYKDALLLSVFTAIANSAPGCIRIVTMSPWGASTLLWYVPLAFLMGVIAFTLVPFAILSGFVYVRTRYWPIYEDWQCSNCGYDLTGNVSGVCPECGTPSAPNLSAETDDCSIESEEPP
ncbi:MAG: hypothetical protein DHS20C16_00330 [Phycisphaerae bacterium]|nr:MAG: hypothetical protein DHS20C16_00330 [Phycisphaerae bacterium]